MAIIQSILNRLFRPITIYPFLLLVLVVATGEINRASAQTLPAPWQQSDIGSVGATGITTLNNGVFTSYGSGADIEGTSDAFHFTYQSLNGDITVIARVDSVANTNGYAKAGLMLRDSLNANSVNVFFGITPLHGLAFQYRLVAGGGTTASLTSGFVAPVYIKLERLGNTITGYSSVNGTTWIPVGNVNIAMNVGLYAGLANTSHQNGVLGKAVYSSVLLGGQGNAALAPSFSLPSGVYASTQMIVLSSATSGATIYYTIDGTLPTNQSAVYSTPIAISQSTRIMAFASSPGLINSQTSTANYLINMPNPNVLTGSNYTIINKFSGKAIDVDTGSLNNGARLHQWQSFPNAASQHWVITYEDSGFYQIKNVRSLKAMDVAGGSVAEGATIHQWTPIAVLQSQQWVISNLDSGFVKIENRKSGRVLGVVPDSTANGAAINQYAYTGLSSQKWKLGQLPTGANPDGKAAGLTIYPNPSSGLFYFTGTSYDESLKLTDQLGRNIPANKVFYVDGVLDLSNMPSGIYFIVSMGKPIRIVKL